MEKKQFLILLGTLSALFFIGGFFGANSFLNHKFDDIFEKTFAVGTPLINKNIDKFMDEEQNELGNFNNSFFTSNNKNSNFMFFTSENTNSNTIKTEENKDCYKIIVNLKPFNNDEKNVKVKI